MAASGMESSNGVPYGVGISSRNSLPWQASPPPASSRISPAVLFTIVILALIFFIAGLLHLLFRFLVKKRPSSSAASSSASPNYSARRRGSAGDLSGGGGGGTGGLQRQLRQLFRLHDSGLDQAFIDALPLFLYREILGSKDPFDCAVCLCEFEPEDKLRLLPVCGHAFHLNCIDTWLLSNSTCPLCRGAIFAQGLTVENPIFDLEESREDHGLSGCWDAEGDDIISDKRVFSVRLGKFKNLSNDDGSGGDDGGGANIGCNRIKEVGETSSSSLDARRCFSMGYYQYVVGDSDLQVALGGFARTINGDGESFDEGKRLGFGSRDESLSVSKIWQWSEKKGKFPVAASFDGSLLPWMRTSLEEETPP